MDPNQRLFLQTAYEAIEDAGYGGEKIRGSNTGVYVGMSNLGDIPYINFIKDLEPEFMEQALTSNTQAILPSRISYTFDLHGPSMLIDTACSSSLVALATACRSLRDKECEMAIAGGVKIYLLPLKDRPLLGIESSDGKTHAFDENSDGTGVGEGTAAVLLKPIHQAVKDRDHIYGVIKGIGVNQDGRTIGISAPDPVSQAKVIEKAWKDAGINPMTINHIEAHGTGTKLGNPIEIDGLTRAYSKYSEAKSFCAISTVKTNIGHLYDMSGLSSLIKVLMELKYKELAPTINFSMPNSKIDFINSPFYLNDQLREWEPIESIRRCGISSFGFSGTNCHIVLEEAPKATTGGESFNLTEVFVVSAKNLHSLKESLQNHLKYFEENKGIDIHDFCYTANTGRGQYEYRLAFMFENLNELMELLKLCIDYDLDENRIQKINKVYFGYHRVMSGKNTTVAAGAISNEDKQQFTKEANVKLKEYKSLKRINESLLKSICELFVKGGDVGWNNFYKGEKRIRLSIPVYPLQKERCWITLSAKTKLSSESLEGDFVSDIQLFGKEDNNYTDTEIQLAQIWCIILGGNKLNIFDDYLEIGGDSISGAKIINLVNSEMKKNLSVANLMEYRTINELAKYIDTIVDDDTLPVIKRSVPKEYYPLSSSQKRIFITSLMKKNVYNVPGVLVFTGKLDFNKFKDTLQKIAERHEILRTTFGYLDKEIVQYVREKAVISIEQHEAEEKNIAETIKSYIKPFDLKQLPLFRFHIFRVGEERYYLLYDFHHIIIDGTSFGLFMNEFIQQYSGRLLSELPLQYKDYSIWQNEILNQGYLKKQERFWLNKFKKPRTVLQLPYDYSRPKFRSYQGRHSFFGISDELKNGLRKYTLKNNCTLFVPLLSAYSILLNKYSNQNEIVIGIPVAGRQNNQLENLIGVFINSLAIVTEPKNEYTLTNFVERTNKEVLNAFKNQDYPFDMLVGKLKFHNSTGRNAIFDTMFQYQNMEMTDANCTEVSVERFDIENEIALFDITLEITESDSGLNCRFKYCSDLFKPETVDVWKEEYLEILKLIVENKVLKINEIAINQSTQNIVFEPSKFNFN